MTIRINGRLIQGSDEADSHIGYMRSIGTYVVFVKDMSSGTQNIVIA